MYCITNTHFTLRYRIRRKKIESNFFLSINDKSKQSLSLIYRKKFDSILFLRNLYLSVKWILKTNSCVSKKHISLQDCTVSH